MAISYACAMGHAPGITAWRDAAPAEQRERLYASFERLRAELAAAQPDVLVLFTSEHWANFFLDHVSPYCIGRAEQYQGPIEPWLKIKRTRLQGDPELASAIIEACYRHDVEPGFSYELQLDHGTMVPLHFLLPRMNLPIVPIFINTLSPPLPTGRRALALGRVVGEVARSWPRRVGIIATGGMSHDPGERGHGTIDTAFDQAFLDHLVRGDLEQLAKYTPDDFSSAGAGAVELLSWIALAGALQRFRGEVAAYEPVRAWATGIGAMSFAILDQ